MFNDFFKPLVKNGVFLNFIGGKWVSSSDKDSFHVANPYNGKVVFNVQNISPEDITKNVVESGVLGKVAVNKLSLKERSKILSKCAKLLTKYSSDFVKALVLEAGKPVCWANGEVKASIEYLTETAKEVLKISSEELVSIDGKTRCIVSFKPVGLVLGITPFNYPLFSVVSKFASAFAGGNSIIIKPASDTPISALLFTKIAEEGGIPTHSLNTISGKSSKIGNVLVSNPKVNMINLTGSTSAGESVLKEGGVKKYLLELGGKCAAIILDDADIELAANECVKGCFKQSGERCDAVSRVLIANSAASKFTSRVLELVKCLKMGDPSQSDVSVGPLINEFAVEKVESLVADAVSKGAKVLCGGKKNGNVFEPTVIDNVTPRMRISHEEIFGPVMPIIRVKNDAEAVLLSNSSEFGLDSCVFSKNTNKALKLAGMLEDGSTTINASPSHGFGEFPFGGNKKSGIGREGVKDSIYECMTKKSVKIANFLKK